MSAQFAIDPALASNNPTTTAPSNLTKPAQHAPPSPPKQPGFYSIFPAPPPLPGWGPFPGPMFAPPGAVLPMPVYVGPSASQTQPGTWPEMAPVPAQPKPAPAHYPSPKDASKSAVARPRRADPPPINPAAAASPHYQNPGGFGGVYTPPSHLSTSSTDPSDPNANSTADSPSTSHYTNTKSHSTPLTTLTSSGRQFACGQVGCNAAFDRKSDCERHRRTHAKGATEARPFRCGRVGCEAAFDRKDALMRHERNERTHLVRQTQPGRVKRPTRSVSKSDFDSSEPQPRRQSTRKRKSLLPNTADMYASDEDDEDEDEDDHPPSVKRSRTGLGSGSRTGFDVGPSTTTLNGPNTPNLDDLNSTTTDRAGTRMEDMVVLPEPDDAPLVIDPRLHGLRADEDYDAPEGGLGVETMQAVEAIQAALQQIEADADAENGRVG